MQIKQFKEYATINLSTAIFPHQLRPRCLRGGFQEEKSFRDKKKDTCLYSIGLLFRCLRSPSKSTDDEETYDGNQSIAGKPLANHPRSFHSPP